MTDKKICAVILNYNTYEDAICCAESILKSDYTNYEIIIVENGSKNDSYEKLNEVFKNNSKIHLIKSEVNLGFAKGNNLGIDYARQELNADYVFVTNSDIVVPPTLFSQIAEYNADGIGAISPTVYRADGSYQMPNENSNDIMKRIRFTVTHLIYARLRRLFKKPKSNFSPVKNNIEQHENITFNKYVLQGCSYFLTPDFFFFYNRLYPKTFLYWEEINLLYYLYKANLGSVLLKTDKVIHKDKGTTKTVTDDIINFQLKQSTKSMFKSLPLFFKNQKTISKKY